MKKVSLGIIGCGIAARELHLPALQKLASRFEITAVCNHTEPKAKMLAEMAGGVPYVLDYRELLRRDDVEAVDIVLPITLNCRVTIDALKAGRHVIVEKPIATNLAEAHTMLGLTKRFRQVMMVAENFRYRTLFRHVQRFLRRGAVGRPYAAIWNVLTRLTPDNPYTQTSWRRKHQYEGGFLTDGGVHHAAAIRMLFGEVRSVSAFTQSINHSIGKLDTLSFQFETETDVKGIFTLLYSAIGVSENRLLIFGTKGTLVVEENRIQLRREGKGNAAITIQDDPGYQGEFLDFHSAIRTGRRPRSSFAEGFQDLRLILAAVKAGQTGRRIHLRGA
jgi:predicted dehydrogenase